MIQEEIYKQLNSIYNKHRKKYRNNPDSKQMCCMWSVAVPPDIIEATPPFIDIEVTFDISLTEEDCLDLYDMGLNEASKKISQVIRANQQINSDRNTIAVF